MNVLVLSEDYPNNDGHVKLKYIHTRNVFYQKNGIQVTHLNFSARESYVYEGVQVITLKDYVLSDAKYDLLILHAANLKHHYIFLKKYGDRFSQYLFFYHGHEVLRRNKVYSKPYSYIKTNRFKRLLVDIYDICKLYIWRRFLLKVKHKSYFVFVSNWMYEEFLKWTRIPKKEIYNRSMVTYNCVGELFESNQYNDTAKKRYDFVTIRNNLDGSKYAIDIVNRLAHNTPNGRFLVVGKGEIFSHYKKAPNLEWRNQTMSHKEIIDILNDSRFALMPTRTDAQGLMMCEMAAFGIPLITSNIPVCGEVFMGFDNVFFIDNEDVTSNLMPFLQTENICKKDTRFYEKNTAQREVDLIKELILKDG